VNWIKWQKQLPVFKERLRNYQTLLEWQDNKFGGGM
jgi:hypothetical protein